jgi:hypothetical protein
MVIKTWARVGAVAQVEEKLPRQYKALSSNLRTKNKKTKKRLDQKVFDKVEF